MRKLIFTLPIEMMNAKERKYVKKFDGTFEVRITANGTPLASKTRLEAHGRAFVFISFEFKADKNQTYVVVGNRLLTARGESIINCKDVEKRASKLVKTLRW